MIEKIYELKESDIGRAMPGFEIRSMQHEHLYSRLIFGRATKDLIYGMKVSFGMAFSVSC